MILYRADYYIDYDNEYDQKEFLKTLEDNFRGFDTDLHLLDEDKYGQCFIFDSIKDALQDPYYGESLGIKISKFDLTEEQIKNLLISKRLKVVPEKIFYYSWNETTLEFDEFKLKAFL